MNRLAEPVTTRHQTKAINTAVAMKSMKGNYVATRPRVLALDDNEDTLELISMSLKDEFDVLTLSDPMDTYELIDLFEPDLLILDIMMPKINGYQLIEMIRRSPKTRELPVIFLSAKNSTRDIRHGYKLGASLYLTKPFQADRLIRNVKAQFELNPPEGEEKKRLNIEQIHMHLQMRATSQMSRARVSSTQLGKRNIISKTNMPKIPKQGGFK